MFLKKLFGAKEHGGDENSTVSLSRSESAATIPTDTVGAELVAVIMASVMACYGGNVTSDLKIKSIKRVGRHSPVWNTAGRDEYIGSKL